MSKENCKGIKCAYCLEDPVCCNGNYHPLIDESFCNTCMNATKCYETHFPVISCSEYVPDVPQAASAPRHIDTFESCRDTCTLAPWCSSCCMCDRYERGED